MEVYVEKGAACQSIGCGGRPQSPSGHKRCTWGGRGTPRASVCRTTSSARCAAAGASLLHHTTTAAVSAAAAASDCTQRRI